MQQKATPFISNKVQFPCMIINKAVEYFVLVDLS